MLFKLISINVDSTVSHNSIKDMLFIGIEIVHSKDPYVLGAREGYYINRFDTIDKGLNSNRTKA